MNSIFKCKKKKNRKLATSFNQYIKIFMHRIEMQNCSQLYFYYIYSKNLVVPYNNNLYLHLK